LIPSHGQASTPAHATPGNASRESSANCVTHFHGEAFGHPMPPSKRSYGGLLWCERDVIRTMTDVIRSDGTVRKTRRTINEPGHAHELTFSCHDRLPLLSKDRTRQWFIDALRAARERHRFSLWAYVVMPEHVHVLLLPQDDSAIERILQSIKLPVSRRAMAYLRSEHPEWMKRLEVAPRRARRAPFLGTGRGLRPEHHQA
jgi:REP element-mobilizing transposase RayT